MWHWSRKRGQPKLERSRLELILRYGLILQKLEELELKLPSGKIPGALVLIWDIRKRISDLQEEVRSEELKVRSNEFSRN